MDNTIHVRDISKTYDSGVKALDNVNFSIDKGEIFGFLGPNGAGKTTAVKLLNGTLLPTGGESSVFGINPATHPEKVHAIAGVVTEHAQMYDHLTGLDNLLFFGEVFGLSKDESKERSLELLEELGLHGAKEQKLSSYSTGMRQRLSLARALMHRPQILFLDEPTSGLDPESVKQVNALIKKLATEQGVTIFLCTHQLRYAQEICTYYGLIDNGFLFATGNLEALREKVSTGVRVHIKTDIVPENFTATSEHNVYEIQAENEATIPHLVRGIVEKGGNVFEVLSKKPSLEEIYFTLIENREKEGNHD